MPVLVSIIVPAYNAERWLAATLESALAQTWPAVEIIVVDDGSTDATPAIARSFEMRGIRVIRQANRGLSGARNAGLHEARGELVQFLDADDLLSPDKIGHQVSLLQTAPPGTLALSRWGRFRDDVAHARFGQSPLWRDFTPHAYLALTFRLGFVAPVHAWLVPRSLIEAAGSFDERLRVTEDVEFFTRVLLVSAGVRYCAQGCCYYRSFHTVSLSRLRSRMASESLLASAEAVERHMRAADSSADVRRACANHYQHLVYKLPARHRDLAARAQRKVAELGGSDVRPLMGRRGRWLARLIGWRATQWLRIRLWTWGVYPGKDEMISE